MKVQGALPLPLPPFHPLILLYSVTVHNQANLHWTLPSTTSFHPDPNNYNVLLRTTLVYTPPTCEIICTFNFLRGTGYGYCKYHFQQKFWPTWHNESVLSAGHCKITAGSSDMVSYLVKKRGRYIDTTKEGHRYLHKMVHYPRICCCCCWCWEGETDKENVQ